MNFSKYDKANLSKLISAHPELYDYSYKNYKDMIIKDNIIWKNRDFNRKLFNHVFLLQ